MGCNSMANASSLFFTLMLMQIFFSLGVTMITAVLPTAQANQLVIMTNSNSTAINITTLSNSMVGGVGSQQTIPLIEFGALIFYSTNIFLNLVINFFFAVPQMIMAFINILFIQFIPISPVVLLVIQTSGIGVITIVYYYLLLIYIMGLRAPQGGVAR